MSTQKIMAALEECNHFDPDNRYVGALDLCKTMLEMADKQALEEALEKKICKTFIAHLNDKNLDVQTNAVRSIQKTATILKDSNLIMIVETLAQMVTDPKGTKEVRDVYSLAIRNTLQELNDKSAVKLIRTIYPKFVIGMQTGNDEITEECLDILSEVAKKFPHLIMKNPNILNKDELLNFITKFLQHNNRSVAKKAAQALGNFSVILPHAQLVNMVKDRMKVLDQEKNKPIVLTTLQALAHVTRNVGSKLPMLYGNMVNQLAGVPIAILNPTDSQDDDNEIAEAAMQAIENLIKKCPAEAKDSIRNMFKLTQDTIKYDPNFNDDDVGNEDMEMDDDDGWGADDGYDDQDDMNDDDTAWTGRKSAVKIIEALVGSVPGFLK